MIDTTFVEQRMRDINPVPGVDDINTTCAGNVATTVVPVEATDAMYGRVAIQGKPRLPRAVVEMRHQLADVRLVGKLGARGVEVRLQLFELLLHRFIGKKDELQQPFPFGVGFIGNDPFQILHGGVRKGRIDVSKQIRPDLDTRAQKLLNLYGQPSVPLVHS